MWDRDQSPAAVMTYVADRATPGPFNLLCLGRKLTEPASRRSKDAADPTAPQQELPEQHFLVPCSYNSNPFKLYTT